MCRIVSIDDIENAENKTLYIDFNEKIEGINSDEPVNAELELVSLGEFIEVAGNVKAVVKLECDLCLKEYTYEMDFDIEEIYAKDKLLEEYSLETEIKEGQFVTDLNGKKEIDIYDLLYQSLILNLPNKKVCGINCNGNKFLSEEDLTDPRMDVFKNIEINPKNK